MTKDLVGLLKFCLVEMFALILQTSLSQIKLFSNLVIHLDSIIFGIYSRHLKFNTCHRPHLDLKTCNQTVTSTPTWKTVLESLKVLKRCPIFLISYNEIASPPPRPHRSLKYGRFFKGPWKVKPVKEANLNMKNGRVKYEILVHGNPCSKTEHRLHCRGGKRVRAAREAA